MFVQSSKYKYIDKQSIYKTLTLYLIMSLKVDCMRV